MDSEAIIEKYREAGADERLGLFRGYRDLRDEFSRIDDETVAKDAARKGLTWWDRITGFL
jgi:hypothetical protein